MDEDRATRSRYRVIERLAAGGMAEVFYAEAYGAADFRKAVAIKRVLPHLAANAKFIRMFLDEARLAARLSHRNIVQVFDVGRMGDGYFIVMEYVDGVTLRGLTEHLAKRGRTVPVPVAVHIAIEAANALAYAHDLADRTGKPLGIVHRDVSPPNVLISRSGGVKLVDFGLARAATQLEKTDPGVVKGKFAYLAPETAAGGVADRRADLFALGTVLWEMLAGRSLFTAEDDWKTLERVKKCDVPSLHALEPAVPEALDAIVRRALAKDPAARFQKAGELSRALTGFLFANGTPVTADDLGALVRDVLGETDARAFTGRHSAVSADRTADLLALSPVDPGGSPVTPPGVSAEVVPAPVAPAAPSAGAAGGSRWMLYAGIGLVVLAGAVIVSVATRRQAANVPSSATFAAHGVHDATSDASTATPGVAIQPSPVTVTTPGVVNVPSTVAHADSGTVEVTQDASIEAPVVANAPSNGGIAPSAPLPAMPGVATRAQMYREIAHGIDACEGRFGWQGRHARVVVTYEGATGRAVNVRISGTYFPRHPIGACIEDAVRAAPAPRFQHARWTTDYAFWLR